MAAVTMEVARCQGPSLSRVCGLRFRTWTPKVSKNNGLLTVFMGLGLLCYMELPTLKIEMRESFNNYFGGEYQSCGNNNSCKRFDLNLKS